MGARVNIGDVLISIRTKMSNIPHAQEALRRAKFKFPGRQKVFVSRKFGFTPIVNSDFKPSRLLARSRVTVSTLRPSKDVVPLPASRGGSLDSEEKPIRETRQIVCQSEG